MPLRYAIFVINLLQDVNIVRPLVFMAARDLGLRTEFLVSHYFLERDKSFVWRQELDEIGEATGTPMLVFGNEMQALQLLQDKAGVLVAASESDLLAHKPVHDVLRQAPASLLRITLQHGFECIGFLHNHAHDVAHGRQVTFAADVVCGWCDGSRLTSMVPSQRSKLYVAGPPTVLQMPPLSPTRTRSDVGLVCENLHSVRLNVSGDFKDEFIGMFNGFCARLAAEGRSVVLRPHPGGQYSLKNNVALPPNATVNNHPIYKVDLAKYAYGVSAPSSVLLDMMLAGIPTAVWRDPAGAIDTCNYAGLIEISTLGDWLDFSREAVAHPDRFIERQQQFLERQQMPTNPAEVHARFANLFAAGARIPGPIDDAQPRTERVLFVANAYVTTLQVSFIKPLAPLVDTGEIAIEVLTETQMKVEFGPRLHDRSVRPWLDGRFALFRPTLLVFCRYSGPHAEYIAERARRQRIPVVYHIDDDLLNVPVAIGAMKGHNDPQRLATVRHLLDNSDLVYCSTERLKERFEASRAKSPLISGKIYCSGHVLSPAVERPVRTVGCMGVDKGPDLEALLPAVVAYLRRNKDVQFELFGSILKPPALEEFGDRISVAPSVQNYDDFLNTFAKMQWDIGICPLLPTEFNMVKANTKWVDYTSVGAAVVASRGTVYDNCCADGCGILAHTADEWLAALEKLTHDPAERFAQVCRAQKKLADEYSTERLRLQVLDVFAQARSRRESLRDEPLRAVQL
jgi:hypothetical protein